MFNPSSNNPAYYSKKNDTSEFRFVLMTSNRFEPEMKVEHKCCICGTVQIDDGLAVTFTHPSGIPSVYCGTCFEGDEAIIHCGECNDEINGDEIYSVYDVPDDYGFPMSMEHYGAICVTCKEDSGEPDEPFDIDTLFGPIDNETPINTPEENTMNDTEAAATEKRIDEAFQKLESKVDALQDYLQGRDALFQDFRDGEITMEDVEAALERLKTRLK